MVTSLRDSLQDKRRVCWKQIRITVLGRLRIVVVLWTGLLLLRANRAGPISRGRWFDGALCDGATFPVGVP